MSNSISNIFGSRLFTDDIIKDRLSSEKFARFCEIREGRAEWEAEIADDIAEIMRDWALANGATHYTHWFSPLTGMNAGKHDSFITGIDDDGHAQFAFTGKALIKGEPDASSFPSGGLRATFEARGYTAWDPTSPAFIIGTTLHIPTAFCSYSGEALDQKTPLLRSMQALEVQALRVLRALGDEKTQGVKPAVGAEQEYFLIDRESYERRLDLKIVGRTLFGARPPKGQEMDDHYYGRIRMRVMAFMEDLDRSLWELGIPAKTRHNEAAPSQHELACLYSTVNIACDHNQITMSLMHSLAKRHGFACLLHEKPFAGVNGSGKHNNWSLLTDRGENLLYHGKTEKDRLRYLLFISAMISAVDKYPELVRLSASCVGNDQRLGGNEAPPVVVSVFLGEPLENELRDIASGIPENSPHGRVMISTGVSAIPPLKKDDSDRNRTSPFAFTGNKFEFRMVGASQSIGFVNTVINTVYADALREIADSLEDNKSIEQVIGDIYRAHSRVIFNGNNYSKEWAKEAAARGLPAFDNCLDTLPIMQNEKNIALFELHGVLSRTECLSRYEIMLDNYIKTVTIEAGTMHSMVEREILPACVEYCSLLADSVAKLKAVAVEHDAVLQRCSRLAVLTEAIVSEMNRLQEALDKLVKIDDLFKRASAARTVSFTNMKELRALCDTAETLVNDSCWPLPTYTELLYKQ